MGKRMALDVNVNMTYEVDADDFAIFLEDEEGDEEEALRHLAEDLEGFEIQGTYGRAWVCSVDEVSKI